MQVVSILVLAGCSQLVVFHFSLALYLYMVILVIKRKLCVRLHSFSLNTSAFTKNMEGQQTVLQATIQQLLWGANIAESNI